MQRLFLMGLTLVIATTFTGPVFAKNITPSTTTAEIFRVDHAPLLFQQQDIPMTQVEKINQSAAPIADQEAILRNMIGFGWGSFSQDDTLGGSVLFLNDLINAALIGYLGSSIFNPGNNQYFIAFVIIPATLFSLVLSRILAIVIPAFHEEQP